MSYAKKIIQCNVAIWLKDYVKTLWATDWMTETQSFICVYVLTAYDGAEYVADI